MLDARYEKVRQGGLVQDAAVLIAVGTGADGKRDVLGVSVALPEHETHWRAFLQSLVERGLSDVQLITSDERCDLRAARKAVFGSVAWQRRQFPLQQNASAYLPKLKMKAESQPTSATCSTRQTSSEPTSCSKRLRRNTPKTL